MMFQRNAHPLTLAEIAAFAPSAMAVSQHSSRSDRYTYIPTSEVIAGMERAGFLPFSATQSRCRDAERRDYTKHLIRFRQMSDIQRAAVVGELVPEIVLVNAHDGTAAYSLMAGIWRFVCGNGMMVSDSTLASIHIRHSGDIVGQVIEGSLAIAGQSQKALEHVGNWQRLQLSRENSRLSLRQPTHYGSATPKGKRTLRSLRHNCCISAVTRIAGLICGGRLTAFRKTSFEADCQPWHATKTVVGYAGYPHARSRESIRT